MRNQTEIGYLEWTEQRKRVHHNKMSTHAIAFNADSRMNKRPVAFGEVSSRFSEQHENCIIDLSVTSAEFLCLFRLYFELKISKKKVDFTALIR